MPPSPVPPHQLCPPPSTLKPRPTFFLLCPAGFVPPYDSKSQFYALVNNDGKGGGDAHRRLPDSVTVRNPVLRHLDQVWMGTCGCGVVWAQLTRQPLGAHCCNQ
eukprot:355307-Chlamydomonas_euryale.AAC.1